MRTAEERFWAKVEVGVCWRWTAALDTYGYGSFWLAPSMRLAHRVAWEMLVGPIPEGLTLDHLCRNRACVNPDHLEPVPHGENVRRSPAAHITRLRPREPFFPCGHPRSGENLLGCRKCRICNKVRCREAYQRRRLAVNP